MTINQLISFIRENPSVLKRPIMVDDSKIQVGYNEEEITVFIPRARRIAEMGCTGLDCDDYQSEDCDYDIKDK